MTEETDPRSENEKYYDDVVAPMLLQLVKDCEERGMNIVATVEYDPGAFGTSVTPNAGESDALYMAYLAARSHGNFDSLAFNWLKHIRASNRPHGSIVMKQMGLALDPKDRT